MNKKEIQDFLTKANKTPVQFCFVDVKKPEWEFLSSSTAWTSSSKKIHINKRSWKKIDYSYKIFILLHELGHVNDVSFYHKPSIVQRELFAQIWAIKRAKAMKMFKISTYIKKLLGIWEYLYYWNTKYRRYILASRLAKKTGII